MKAEATPPRLTYAQMAAMVSKSVSTVERWVRDGHIPYHRVGRSIRFDLAEIRVWLEENEITSDNRIQPVRPLKKKGGAQHVYPSQTLGDIEHCWCGEPIDHEWPDKDKGAPHPHDHEGIQQVVIVEQQTEDARVHDRINKSDLRGYHATLKSFLIQCINRDELPWRPQKNAILLYPPDDTPAISVRCRNNDTQMQSLKQWYAAHVEPSKRADDDTVRRLAEQVNDPVEHPVRKPEPGWHPYHGTDGEMSDYFETDDATVRCRICHGTDHEYSTPITEVRGLGGHIRMHHRPTDNLRTPEAIAKSVDSRRYNRLYEKVLVAVELLAETIDYTPGGDKLAALERRIAELEHSLEKASKRADDAQARLQLLQEAFKGLE